MLNSNNNIKKQSKVMIFHPTSTYRATVLVGFLGVYYESIVS